MSHRFELLLVEDDPEDVELTREALKGSKIVHNLAVVDDGAKAMAYLRREGPYAEAPRPDIVLLDLNLPLKDGREVLREIKNDPDLKTTPVLVLTTSDLPDDIEKAYALGANCFIIKPVGLKAFAKAIRAIEDFWFALAKLPRRPL